MRSSFLLRAAYSPAVEMMGVVGVAAALGFAGAAIAKGALTGETLLSFLAALMLNLRYLRPFSVGPARATATRQGPLVVVDLEDAGSGKLGAVATVRLDHDADHHADNDAGQYA